jgi:hypothetical protein
MNHADHLCDFSDGGCSAARRRTKLRRNALPGSTMSGKLPWYHAGLRFGCRGCGNCCTGEPGYVWVVQSEIEQLAEMLSLDVDQFETLFVRNVGRRKSLIEMPNGDCVFLQRPSMRCKVYPARPLQCRTWPFWSSNLRTPEDWAKTAQRCPGTDHGRLYSLKEIDAALDQDR